MTNLGYDVYSSGTWHFIGELTQEAYQWASDVWLNQFPDNYQEHINKTYHIIYWSNTIGSYIKPLYKY